MKVPHPESDKVPSRLLFFKKLFSHSTDEESEGSTWSSGVNVVNGVIRVNGVISLTDPWWGEPTVKGVTAEAAQLFYASIMATTTVLDGSGGRFWWTSLQVCLFSAQVQPRPVWHRRIKPSNEEFERRIKFQGLTLTSLLPLYNCRTNGGGAGGPGPGPSSTAGPGPGPSSTGGPGPGPSSTGS